MDELIIRIVKRFQDQPDYLIHIIRENRDRFTLVHNGTYRQVFNRIGVISYVNILLYSLINDAQPFPYMQITGPGFPTILYCIGDLVFGDVSYSVIIARLMMFIEN